MNLPPVRTVTMRGKVWNIARFKEGDAAGMVEAPSTVQKRIDIPVHGGTRKDLDVIVHESLHACLWDLDEEAVYETAFDIARQRPCTRRRLT